MGDIIKELFKGVGEKLRTPQVLALIVITLLIFKVIFRLEFINLMQIFVSGIGKFGFLINFFQLTSIMLFITSVISFAASIVNTITYLVINEIIDRNEKETKNLLDKSMIMQRFFIGSKSAVVNVNMWLLVDCSYFYIFDEWTFNKYKNYILNYFFSANLLIKFVIAIYILTIIVSLLKLVEKMSFRFLYCSLDAETEKMLYKIRNKDSAE